MTGDALGPVNMGVFAVKPSKELMEASVLFLQSAAYSQLTGWSNAGFGPFKGPYVGSECGQGFLHTMFFKQDYPPIQEAAQQAGIKLPPGKMIDLCRWNYLHGWECPVRYPC